MGLMSRAVQRTKEKAGKGHQTGYPVEFQTKQKEAEATKEHMEKMVSAMEETVSMFGSGITKSEKVAEVATKLLNTIPANDPHHAALSNLVSTQRHYGKAERQLQKTVREDVINPLKQWLKVDWGEIARGRDSLKKKRLDMDAAYQKNIKKPSDENQTAFEQAEGAHEQQFEVATGLYDKMPEHWQLHKELIAAYIQAHADFYDAGSAAAAEGLKKA